MKHTKNILALTLLVLYIVLVLCGCCDPNTVVEENNGREYKICSVTRYIKTDTNVLGGVTGTHLCYAFTYTDESGTLHSVDSFENREYGITKVCIGDENKYVVNNEYRYLYLTQETLESISKEII